MITIVGWLWQQEKTVTRYEIEHANVWARMIHRNLRMPHRFVVMTDLPGPSHGNSRWREFDDLISPIALWHDWRDIRNPKWTEEKPQCYVRLKAFSRSAEELFGERFASVDLDCVVVDNLDPIFNREEDFVIWRRPVLYRETPVGFNDYVGSMWMMNAGARPQVYEQFKGTESIEAASKYMGSDQAWIRHVLGPDEAGWTTADGVYSFVTHIRSNPLKWGHNPPLGARIIFFQGGEKPWDHLDEEPHCAECGAPVKVRPPWLLRRNFGPARDSFQWIKRYWQ